jgi:hypothetical protein
MPYRKINSKLITYLKLRAKTIKLLEDNIGEHLHRFGNNFMDLTPKAQTRKGKMCKLK